MQNTLIKIATKYILTSLIAVTLLSCEETEDFGEIEGSWTGDKSEISLFAEGIPIAVYSDTNEDFDTDLEFQADGTLIVTLDDVDTSGSWEWVTKNKKLMATADFGVELIGPTETFTVKKLTESNLVISLEKNDTVEDPETHETITGTIKATLYFTR